MKATVTSKGQVTIPLSVRSQAHITTGTQLDFHCEPDGTIIIRPIIYDVGALKGIVKVRGRKPVSLKAMKQAIRDSASETM